MQLISQNFEEIIQMLKIDKNLCMQVKIQQLLTMVILETKQNDEKTKPNS